MRDYANIINEPDVLNLHRRFQEELNKGEESWTSYDYGEGYFYQGLQKLAVTGLRDTDARVAAMGLDKRIAGKQVLEIGCNSGFLSLSISEFVDRVVGIDVNPMLLEIAEIAADYLKVDNCSFTMSRFEDYETEEHYDAVISFANPSTYDGNTKQSLESYFDRCCQLLKGNGLLLFESHPPAHEGANFDRVVEIIAENFEILTREILSYGTFLDKNRTFICGTKK
jgi:cyclopropane fatty-acyl-phospholipid synthase-like methyltransferase